MTTANAGLEAHAPPRHDASSAIAELEAQCRPELEGEGLAESLFEDLMALGTPVYGALTGWLAEGGKERLIERLADFPHLQPSLQSSERLAEAMASQLHDHIAFELQLAEERSDHQAAFAGRKAQHFHNWACFLTGGIKLAHLAKCDMPALTSPTLRAAAQCFLLGELLGSPRARLSWAGLAPAIAIIGDQRLAGLVSAVAHRQSYGTVIPCWRVLSGTVLALVRGDGALSRLYVGWIQEILAGRNALPEEEARVVERHAASLETLAHLATEEHGLATSARRRIDPSFQQYARHLAEAGASVMQFVDFTGSAVYALSGRAGLSDGIESPYALASWAR